MKALRKYRIKQVSYNGTPSRFYIQKKGWFFWNTLQDIYKGVFFDKGYSTEEEAIAYLEELVKYSMDDREDTYFYPVRTFDGKIILTGPSENFSEL